MKTDQYIHDLYQKFLSNKIDAKELQELFDCLDNQQQQDTLRMLIGQTLSSEPGSESDEKVEGLVFDVKEQLRSKLQPKIKERSYWKIYATSAAAAMLMAIGVLYYFQKDRVHTIFNDDQSQIVQQPIEPGSNKAILTLSNGKKIQLDDKNAAIYGESGVEIRQEKDGTIAYQLVNGSGEQANGTNTIEVPKGGQYKVILPDGTKVWLNSVSTLRYPAAFGAVSRTMEMTGEAFFDIAPNKNFPFKVIASGQEVTALGTSFNINAYANEPNITTTLIEGKLKVQDLKADKTVIIYPGQQTISTNGLMIIKQANTDDAMAWKDGLFVLTNASLEAVLRQIERWYDVQVDVRVPAGAGTFSGELPRNVALTELLQSLEAATGIKLKLEGRRVTIRK